MHNIQAYFGKFSLIVMFQKFWPLANLSRSKIKVQFIFGAAFHKLKYEWSLKSLWQLDAKLSGKFDLLLDLDLDLWPRQQ